MVFERIKPVICEKLNHVSELINENEVALMTYGLLHLRISEMQSNIPVIKKTGEESYSFWVSSRQMHWYAEERTREDVSKEKKEMILNQKGNFV